LSASTSDRHPFIRRLETTVALCDRERAALERLPMQLADIRADQDIVREGDRASRSFALLAGCTCTYKVTNAGKRQISAFHVPGDVPDLQSLHLTTLDGSIGTLTPCRVGFMPHEALRDLCHEHPRLADALWRGTLIEGAIFREWTVNVGRRDALSRTAHLLCEWMSRLGAAGLAHNHACELPMTQAELADALGLSTVHVNRTLQELRRSGLVVLTGTALQVPNWALLMSFGDFDPTYLHLQTGAPARPALQG